MKRIYLIALFCFLSGLSSESFAQGVIGRKKPPTSSTGKRTSKKKQQRANGAIPAGPIYIDGSSSKVYANLSPCSAFGGYELSVDNAYIVSSIPSWMEAVVMDEYVVLYSDVNWMTTSRSCEIVLKSGNKTNSIVVHQDGIPQEYLYSTKVIKGRITDGLGNGLMGCDFYFEGKDGEPVWCGVSGIYGYYTILVSIYEEEIIVYNADYNPEIIYIKPNESKYDVQLRMK